MDTKETPQQVSAPDLKTIFIFVALAAVGCVVVWFMEPKEPQFKQIVQEVEQPAGPPPADEFLAKGKDGKDVLAPLRHEEREAYNDLIVSLKHQSQTLTEGLQRVGRDMAVINKRLDALEKGGSKGSVAAPTSSYPVSQMTPCEKAALEFIRLIGTYTPQTAKGRMETAKVLVHPDSREDFDQFIEAEMKKITNGRRSLNLSLQQIPIRCSPAKTDKETKEPSWVFKAIGTQAAAFGHEPVGKSNVAYLLVMAEGVDEAYHRSAPLVKEFSVHPAEMAEKGTKR